MKKYFIILLSFFSLIAFADFHNDENYYVSSYQSGPIIYDKNNEIKELNRLNIKRKKIFSKRNIPRIYNGELQ